MKYVALYGLLALRGKNDITADDVKQLADTLNVEINEKRLNITVDELRKIDFIDGVLKGNIQLDYAFCEISESDAARLDERLYNDGLM